MLEPADGRLAARLPQGILRPLEARYLDEPRGRYHGQAGLVAVPRNVEEVSAVLRT